jgi:Metallopeptidase family M81
MERRPIRIAVLHFSHETVTFLKNDTTLEDFTYPGSPAKGEALLKFDARSYMGGFVKMAREFDRVERPDELRHRSRRYLPASRRLHRQHSAWRKARRFSGVAADQIRVRRQPEMLSLIVPNTMLVAADQVIE